MTHSFTDQLDRQLPKLRAWREDDLIPEYTPSFTLEAHISSLRDVDPERWATLQAEWSTPVSKESQDG